MSAESFIYGTVIGIGLALLIWWRSGLSAHSRMSVLSVALLAGLFALPWWFLAIGAGFETGVVVQLVATAIFLVWRRLRPQPS